MLGHWRPLFLGFAKGGKMVATYGADPAPRQSQAPSGRHRDASQAPPQAGNDDL